MNTHEMVAIGIVDLGICNSGSVRNMLARMGHLSEVVTKAENLSRFGKIILPGVGNFGHAMQRMDELGFRAPILQHAADQKPVLGICLGMQLLGTQSEESDQTGLGLVDVSYSKFDRSKMVHNNAAKIPHMGWNAVSYGKTGETPLTQGLTQGEGPPPRFYFVHSYHANAAMTPAAAVLWCRYGYDFPAAIQFRNIYGVQFHPEKSHRFGMTILDNFARHCN
jgi:imidazole glycerol-phosphate synthase subunit HisH